MTEPSEFVCTGLAPVVAANTRLLILGSMPGVASLAAQAYYAHPRNSFWPIVVEYLSQQQLKQPSDITLPNDFSARYALLLQAGLGLWDVLAQAVRAGSLDANIKKDSLQVNDFSLFFAEYQNISIIALNGQAASHWFHRLVWPSLSPAQQQRLHCHTLPSTSPAHASLSVSSKSQQWQSVLHHARLNT
jgi:hypoxanthine-DNA glycosylase